MKKILTLFVMLLCGWSIVSAQVPAFGYQVVVRTADNELVANTTVNVTIAVMSGTDTLYSEPQTENQTDDLGILNILVGTVNNADFAVVDWSKADTLVTTITVTGGDNAGSIEVKTPILAVPFALQAGKGTLTTEVIEQYLQTPAGKEDFDILMAALVANSNGATWEQIKVKLVNYLKNRKDKAVEIVAYYLKNATAGDLNELYAALNNNEDKDAIVSKAISLMKTYAIDNRGYAMELLPAYVAKVTVDDVTPLIEQAIDTLDALDDNQRQQLKNELLPRLENFAISHRDLVVRTANYFLGSVTQGQMEQLLNVFKNTAMEQVFVYNKTFNFLDYYFQATHIEDAIKTQVDNELAPNYDPENPTGYLKRSQASDCTIEPCN